MEKLRGRAVGWLRHVVAVVLGNVSEEEGAGMTEYMTQAMEMSASSGELYYSAVYDAKSTRSSSA